MSVMSCSRKDCNNIFCNTYIPGIGYICHDCQTEFKKYLQGRELNLEIEIKSELEIFIDTSKDAFSDEKITIDEFFNKYT